VLEKGVDQLLRRRQLGLGALAQVAPLELLRFADLLALPAGQGPLRDGGVVVVIVVVVDVGEASCVLVRGVLGAAAVVLVGWVAADVGVGGGEWVFRQFGTGVGSSRALLIALA